MRPLCQLRPPGRDEVGFALRLRDSVAEKEHVAALLHRHALAAVIGIGRSGAASPTIDNNVPLEAIAAVLLGGTRINGGSGGVGGTALGVLFLATLGNGLSLSDISSYWQQIVTGVILVSAVLLNRLGAAR